MNDKSQPHAPPALPALRCKPRLGEVQQSMTEAMQMIAMTIDVTNPNKISVESRAGAYRWSRGGKNTELRVITGYSEGQAQHKKTETSVDVFVLAKGLVH